MEQLVFIDGCLNVTRKENLYQVKCHRCKYSIPWCPFLSSLCVTFVCNVICMFHIYISVWLKNKAKTNKISLKTIAQNHITLYCPLTSPIHLGAGARLPGELHLLGSGSRWKRQRQYHPEGRLGGRTGQALVPLGFAQRRCRLDYKIGVTPFLFFPFKM